MIAKLSVAVQQAIVSLGRSMNSANSLIALLADQRTYYGPPNATVLAWHRVQSSRWREREDGRNVEVKRLTGKLKPHPARHRPCPSCGSARR